MKIETRQQGRTVVVDVHGALTAITGAASLHELMGSVVTRSIDHVVLNLERADRLDGSGIGELVRLRRALQQSATALTLVNLPPRQARLLELVGLMAVFTVCRSVDDALRTGMASV